MDRRGFIASLVGASAVRPAVTCAASLQPKKGTDNEMQARRQPGFTPAEVAWIAARFDIPLHLLMDGSRPKRFSNAASYREALLRPTL